MLRHLAAAPWREPASSPSLAAIRAVRSDTIGLVGLTLAGLALRLALIARFPLREDEAIYAYWALHALHDDPRFLTVWPDKPPLFLWMLGGVFALLGADEAAARWLGIAASVLTIPIVAAGARRLWGTPAAGLAAGLVYTLSPFAVSFAPTVYTDPLLVLWGTLALVMALRGRGGWAGVWLGAAIMTKQQGVLYVPPVLALALIQPVLHARSRGGIDPPAKEQRPLPRAWRGMPPMSGMLPDLQYCRLPAFLRPLCFTLFGMALIVLPVLLWDSTRWAVAPSPWDLATRTYAPLTLAPAADWLARLIGWGELLWYLAASHAVWLLAGMALLVAAWGAPRRPSLAAWIVFGWGIGYLAAHVFTTVQVWDRYLLPLAPLWAWALAQPAARLAHIPPRNALHSNLLRGLLLVGAVCLVPPGLAAARGDLPIGGDHGDYTGLREAMAWVQAQPGRQVFYHQALGWHARFYLYDAIRQGKVELRWFPSSAYLADNAAKTPYPPATLILPDWATPPDLPLHLATRGLEMQRAARMGRFTVYTLRRKPQPACDWCRSVPRAPRWPLAVPPARMSQP